MSPQTNKIRYLLDCKEKEIDKMPDKKIQNKVCNFNLEFSEVRNCT